MALYIIVHHQRDANQPWTNAWDDDDRLRAITTRKDLGKHCLRAMTAGETVYVYRCGWSSYDPAVSCSARVEGVADLGDGAYVTFFNQVKMAVKPPFPAQHGQIFYEGPAPSA